MKNKGHKEVVMVVLFCGIILAAIYFYFNKYSPVTQSYWYCWDTGNPTPHHLGHPVYGDHLCTDQELGR